MDHSVSEPEAIDLGALIDAVVLASLRAQFPAVPSAIANAISDTFFRDARPEDYAMLHAQVLVAVHERLKLFQEQSVNPQ